MSIRVSQITKRYGAQLALDSVSLEVGEGVIAGFLGPNGAGKSTLMKILTGYVQATSGSAAICGIPVAPHQLEIRKKVGYLPESNPLYMDMYVREYLAFCAGLHQIPQSQQKEAIESMIQRTGLGREAHKKIGALSKGYKQRVGLAAAMIHDPEVLILDEPTSGLDPNQLVEIRKLILDLGKSKTLLISTHNMKEVEALCSQVIILDRGVVKANEPIQNLRGTAQASQRILLVELDKPMSKKSLQDIAGVRKVKAISDQQFLLEVTGNQDHRPAVFQWAVQSGCMVLAMHYQEQDMETVFRQRTQNGG